MPFGPTNGPATYVTMIHNDDRVWKESAKLEGIDVDTFVDTNIIIDNIKNWVKSFEIMLKYRLVWATLKTIASSAIVDL